ncbi:sigma-70 family RNA polymerase sigma factor [Singulisphaera sp. PoT]|uniref:sigma-70 family RNA polymerase sigma factor n=1 Tax=Singulisphaera sp. PoT TaxID=3411797 RepID=UPI003BF467F6
MSEVLRDVSRLFERGTLAAESDGELLERFVSRRDEAAFEAIVSRHGPMVLRVSRDLLRDDHAAEDVFQATFLLLARKGRTLWVNESLSGWLYGVARRVAAKSRTSLERRRRLEGDAAVSFASSREVEATPLSPDEARILHEEIARLPASHRLPILLCGLSGLSYAEAAGQLGLTETAIRGRLARGRERLRARLLRRGVGAPVGFLAGTLAADRALGSLNADLVIRRAVEVVMALESRRDSRAARRLATWAASLFQGAVFGKALACGLLLAVGFALGGRGEPAGRWLVATGDMQEEGSALPTPAPAPADEILRPLAPEPVVNPSPMESAPTPSQGIPKPWETTVRVKVSRPDENAIGFGSGTIIRSSSRESLVLVCAHNFGFRVGERSLGLPASNPRTIRVDLFDGKLTSKQAVTPTETLNADIVDFDRERDICLIRIHPGRQLPASPLLPRDWSPEAGAMMITGGCSLGQDATFWSTRVKDPKATLSLGQGSFEVIACEFSPAPGRSGGGLFDEEGRLAGFCRYSEPRSNLGYYANLRAVYELLDRNPEGSSPSNPARKIEPSSSPNEPIASSETSRQSFEKDYERLIQHAERQRQAGDDRGLQESLGALDRRYRTERKALIERVAELDSLHSRSIEPLRSSVGKHGLIRLLPFGPRSGGKQEGSPPPAPDIEPRLELDNASDEGTP